MKNNPSVLFSGMVPWYISHTAREAEKLGSISGYWMGSACPNGVNRKYYKRIWPYHLAQKAFYHYSPANLEERMRWINLRFYDSWIRHQSIPNDANVVHAPMGSCEPLFKMVEHSRRNILKVFDAPNSHPTTQFGFWQRECDLFSNGYQVPVANWVRSRINREIEMADLILCPSDFVRDSMVMNGVPSRKCFVSHFGVDTSVFKKRTSPPPNPRFICVGSLTVRKGYQYLFRAFEIVKRNMPNAELICIGGIRPDFMCEIKKWRGTFEHHVGVPHPVLARMLSECTAFVLPSLEEGFARVLSEAMACGLPVLASYESGATTIVRNGIEGIIFQPRDISAMAEAMMKIANDFSLNVEMGNAAYLAGGRSNTWEDYTSRLLNEYERRLSTL